MNEVKELIKEKLQHHNSISNKEVSDLMTILSHIQFLEEKDDVQLTEEQLNKIAWRLHKKAQSGFEIKAEKYETVS